jgi:hypothetical protein
VKSLIIGKGQVGQSLYNVLKDTHEVYIRDIEPIEISDVKVIHLCFPYSDKFIAQADDYYDLYKPEIVINHASVAVGTTEKIKGLTVYSPIRGRHPNLEDGICTFDKYLASNSPVAAMGAYNYFKVAHIPAKILGARNGMRTLEFCKLMSNIRYGYDIVFMQEAERLAKLHDIDIGDFQDFERSYNKGYRELHEWEKQRSILYGGVLGGHCILPCTDIMNSQSPSDIFDLMKKLNQNKVEQK